MAIKNLGTIVKIHGSGMVESDKGRRFPYSKAKIGDIMLEIDDGIIVVTKDVFAKEYRKEIKAEEKEKAEAEAEEKAMKEERKDA